MDYLFSFCFNRHQSVQSSNPAALWKMPDTNGLTNVANPKEFVVGGVYLRIFIANPAWTLRKPKEFLSELMETCLTLMSKDKPNTELLDMGTTALCSLLQAQPALLDLIPSMGHIPRLCRQMGTNVRQLTVPKSAILILNSLSISSVRIFTDFSNILLKKYKFNSLTVNFVELVKRNTLIFCKNLRFV